MAKRVAVILRVGKPPEVVQDFEHTDYRRMESIVGGFRDFFRPHPDAVDALERELGITGKLRTGAEGWDLRVAVHDEGHRLGLPYNERATKLYQGPSFGRSIGFPKIVGNAVLIEVD